MTALGDRSRVQGVRSRWVYSLRVVNADGSCYFSVSREPDGVVLRITGTSKYRTTKLARYMGDKKPGWQAAAVAAIREFERQE